MPLPRWLITHTFDFSLFTCNRLIGNAMRYITLVLTIAVFLIALTTAVRAQEHPPMTDAARDAEKEQYFATFNELMRFPSADSRRKAYEAAIQYLKRFEGEKDPEARVVREYVTEYERPARQAEILNSYKAKDYAKTFELGRAAVEHDQENFFILSLLTQAGIDSAQAGNAGLNEATLDYGKRAVRLLESGKATRVEPFPALGVAQGYLNAAIGTLSREKSPAEAAQAFRKSVQSESSYRTDPIIYHRMGTAILRGEFAKLSKAYNDQYFGKPTSAAQQEALARINKLGLQALDAYARAVALSNLPDAPASVEAGPTRAKLPPELRDRILEQLTSLYKSFNNNSDAGLKEFIAAVLAKPLP